MRSMQNPMSLRAGAHTGYPAPNPSTGLRGQTLRGFFDTLTGLRPIPLPLGKGGYLSPYYFVPSPSDFTLRRFG